MKYEWDEAKNLVNIEKHDIDFNDAYELFEGDKLLIPDTRMDYGEKRMIAVGRINSRLVVAVYVQRGETTRVISVRKANDREKERYEKRV